MTATILWLYRTGAGGPCRRAARAKSAWPWTAVPRGTRRGHYMCWSQGSEPTEARLLGHAGSPRAEVSTRRARGEVPPRRVRHGARGGAGNRRSPGYTPRGWSSSGTSHRTCPSLPSERFSRPDIFRLLQARGETVNGGRRLKKERSRGVDSWAGTSFAHCLHEDGKRTGEGGGRRSLEGTRQAAARTGHYSSRREEGGPDEG